MEPRSVVPGYEYVDDRGVLVPGSWWVVYFHADDPLTIQPSRVVWR